MRARDPSRSRGIGGFGWTILRASRISLDSLALAMRRYYPLVAHTLLYFLGRFEGWICKGRACAFVMPQLTLRNNVLTPPAS